VLEHYSGLRTANNHGTKISNVSGHEKNDMFIGLYAVSYRHCEMMEWKEETGRFSSEFIGLLEFTH